MELLPGGPGAVMKADCHIHMVLDGGYWRTAMDRHSHAPDDSFIHAALAAYSGRGFTHLRDGGDKYGAGARAKELAPRYGIEYLTTLFPIHKVGHYGGFIGRGFETLGQYRDLVAQVRAGGGDFIKIMISGLMDFDHFGVLSPPPLEKPLIREMIHIAHEEGFAVMAHANGADTVLAAVEAGVDSVEHGAYLNDEALAAMAERGAVWVPTLATIGNLPGTGRFDDSQVELILESALSNVERFASLGGLVACGSDAGAFAVPHDLGAESEMRHLRRALGDRCEALADAGNREIFRRFRPWAK